MADVNIKEVSVAEYASDIAGGHPIVAVDVRPQAEREATTGYIPETLQVDLERILDGSWDPPFDKSAPLLFVCASGRRSLRAATAVAARGFTDVRSMAGGMQAWVAAGLPVSKAPA